MKVLLTVLQWALRKVDQTGFQKELKKVLQTAVQTAS
jgi:hypothetical protein